ncbi:MAG: hypothetical protein WCF10_01120 [Polyangiales bacterium]
MSDLGSNIGPSSRRRWIAAAIAVIGTVFLGSRLAGLWPRDVDVRYTIDPGVVELQADYLQEGEAVASARFRQTDPENHLIRHTVRLQPGTYEAQITLYRAEGGVLQLSRVLKVPSEGPIRFDLKEGTGRSE